MEEGEIPEKTKREKKTDREIGVEPMEEGKTSEITEKGRKEKRELDTL